MTKSFFITGTDTDIGKTTAALALMRNLKLKGYSVGAFKPVAAGCHKTAAGLRNDDALKLQALCSANVDYTLLNPYVYKASIAPHIAAEQTRHPIDINYIKQCYENIRSLADYMIVEGAGGWLVPINRQQSMADVAKALNIPVVVVVGMKLGCINHSLLTFDAIKQHDCQIVGWIANTLVPDMDNFTENLDFLKHKLSAPLLATIPYMKSANSETDIRFYLPGVGE